MSDTNNLMICPVCGRGTMVHDEQDWKCSEHPSCDFMIPGIICNRRIMEQDAVAFLNGKHIALEGFASNEWKMFASSLSIAEDKVKLESRIAKCPHCGGDLHVGLKAYNCANYRNAEYPCKFSIWRNISGHAVSVEEVKQICEQGVTRDCIEFYKEDGTVYYKRLQLTPEKDRIIMI